VFTLKSLRWLSVAAPLGYVVALGLLLELLLRPGLPDGAAYAAVSALALAGIGVFAYIVFGVFQRMQARVQRHADELQTLYEAGVALTSEIALDAVLQKLVDLGRTLTRARYGALSVIALDGTIERFLTSGLTDEERALIGPPRGLGLLGEVLHEGAGLNIPDIVADSRAAGFPPHHPAMSSLLGFPVVSRGRAIGNLYLADKQESAAFDDRDAEMLRLLATQAAIAIENAELYEAERRRAEEWKALFELGEEVTASPDLQALLDSIVERARSLLRTEVAVLMLLDANAEELRMAAYSGVRTAGTKKLRMLRNHSLQGLVVETGKPVVIVDYEADDRLRNRPALFVRQEGLVSIIAVPFSARGRVLGTLTVGNRTPTAFRERQAELLAAFANWAAVAVETSELHSRVRSLALLEERERIGMDLHDGVIQSIYAIGLGLEDTAERIEEEPAAAKQSLDRSIDALNKVIRDIRNYIFDLRPQIAEAGDLKRALSELIEDVKLNFLLDARLDANGRLPALTDEQERGLFHIAQEALNNVAKHARASAVAVKLGTSGAALVLEVADDGIGFDPSGQPGKSRHGLRNMQDRARAIGGSLEISGGAGRGTVVRVELPVGNRSGQ
jgi:signal transduction histidine kinase